MAKKKKYHKQSQETIHKLGEKYLHHIPQRIGLISLLCKELLKIHGFGAPGRLS